MSEQEVLAELKTIRGNQKAILESLASLAENQRGFLQQLKMILKAENIGVPGRVVAGIESER